MRKIALTCLLSLIFVFFLALQAGAKEVDITYPGSDSNYEIWTISGHAVSENYNAQDLILFPSHDGSAVVDLISGQAVYFDTTITFDRNDNPNNFALTFHITNGVDKNSTGTSPPAGEAGKYTWSDYHFILLDRPEGVVFREPDLNSNLFKGITVVKDGAKNVIEVDFFAQDSSQLYPGSDNGTLTFTIPLTFPEQTGSNTLSFDLRQVATAATADPDPLPNHVLVPIPGALVLLGCGLVRLVAHSWKRKALAA